MHNADWDGIKAVPIALITSGIILIFVSFPLFGAIVVGTIALAFLGKWLRQEWILYKYIKGKRKLHENILPTNKVERIDSE